MALFRKGTHGWKLESRRDFIRHMRHSLYAIQHDKSVPDMGADLEAAIKALYRIDNRLARQMQEQSSLNPSDLQE